MATSVQLVITVPDQRSFSERYYAFCHFSIKSSRARVFFCFSHYALCRCLCRVVHCVRVLIKFTAEYKYIIDSGEVSVLCCQMIVAVYSTPVACITHLCRVRCWRTASLCVRVSLIALQNRFFCLFVFSNVCIVSIKCCLYHYIILKQLITQQNFNTIKISYIS